MKELIALFIGVLFLFVGCGPSSEEVNALEKLGEVQAVSIALIRNDITTLTELDDLIQKTDEILIEKNKLDTLQHISEALRDSITTEYNSILSNLSELAVNGSSFVFQSFADSAQVYLEFVNTQCVACSLDAEDFLGFAIISEDPSAWSLRHIKIDSLNTVIEKLNLMDDQITILRNRLVHYHDYPLTENANSYVSSVYDSLLEASSVVLGLTSTLYGFNRDANRLCPYFSVNS